jgi:hypothetical protein
MTLLDFFQTFSIHFLYKRRHTKNTLLFVQDKFNSFHDCIISDSVWINFGENFSEASCSFSGTGEKAYVCTLNPFLFIRGLSCPSCIQASMPNCVKLTIPGFPHNCLPVFCGDIGFFFNPRSSIGLEIGPQSAFTAFRALLPSANYSAE